MKDFYDGAITLLRFLVMLICFIGAFYVLFGLKGIVAFILFSIGAAVASDDMEG